MAYHRGKVAQDVHYVALIRNGIVRSLMSGPYITQEEAKQFCTRDDYKVVTQKIMVEWTYETDRSGMGRTEMNRYVGA